MKNCLRLICILLSIFMLTLVASCDFNTNGTGGSESGIDSSGDDPSNKGPSANVTSVSFGDSFSVTNDSFYKNYSTEEKNLYYRLWDDTTKITLEIDITPYELYKIEQAYTDYANTGNSTKIDTYRRCNLTIYVNNSRYYFEEVGVRMRGNTSRRHFCDINGVIYDFVHLRFNLTETFDSEEYTTGWAKELYHEWTNEAERKARKDRTFATMEKFYYKWNKNFDNTYIREVYANKMFNAYGVLAPHITLCQIKIKQKNQMENLGVGCFYETVDKKFIKRNLPKDLQGGDLYKCAYPADLTSASNYGVETPTQRFTYTLKTNNDREAPDYGHNKNLKKLIQNLNNAKVSVAGFKDLIEEVVDMDYFTTYEAVSYLLGNPDCIRHNANNYYLYFTPDGVAYFIPYDYDRCLGVTMDWNPDHQALVNEKPFEVNGPNGQVQNPLYLKTVLNGGDLTYRTIYANKLKAILYENWFQYSSFSAIYKKYYNTYKDLAMPSENILNSVSGNLRTYLFYFSEQGSETNSSTWENYDTKLYMETKRQVAGASVRYY